MDETYRENLLQISNANKIIKILETKIESLNIKIQKNDSNSSKYMYELKKLNLDLKITKNELEHCQYNLDKCKKKSV